MTINLSLPQKESEIKPRISVIGVGGAGGNAIANMIRADVQGVDFIVANTDAQALNASLADRRIQLGLKITQGLGAGSRPEIGRAAAEETLDEIEQRARRRAHVLHRRRHGRRHRHRRRAGHRQGRARQGHPDRRRRHQAVRASKARRRGRSADAGIDELQQHVDTLIVIPNQNLFRLANSEHDLQGSVRDGRRGAPAGRPRDHRPDGHARPDQPRLRRRPLGDGRDGQGDDGHRRGRRATIARSRPPRRRSPTRCSTASA